MKNTIAITSCLVLAWTAAAQVVKWDIQRKSTYGQRLGRRASTVQAPLSNGLQDGAYFASVSVGTPAQSLDLQLDTGSSDIWVPSSSASICAQGGCKHGSFNYRSSSSFDDFAPGEFDISYVDGTGSKGDYFRDVFNVGGATVANMTMGLGLQTTIPYGLVGIGYPLDEAFTSSSNYQSAPYANLPVLLQQDGLISTLAYSLWLNDLDSNTGTILFGGIDTAKYHGTLSQINIYKDPDVNKFIQFIVALTSIQAVSPSGSDTLSSRSMPLLVVLDSGTSLTYLPPDLTSEIWNEVGAVYSSAIGSPVVPCSMANSAGYLSFGFGGPGGPVINVTMSELVLPMTGSSYKMPSGPFQGQSACRFGIMNDTDSTYLFGDTFLRSAYVVYDLINNQVAMAPTNFNTTSSNIVTFPSASAQIPSATIAPSQATATASSGSAGSPTYGAGPGFTSGVKSAASLPSTFDYSQVIVIGMSFLFMLAGSGFVSL